MLEMYVKAEDVRNNEVAQKRDIPRSSSCYFGAILAEQVPAERVWPDLNLSPWANEEQGNNFSPTLHDPQDEGGYRPDMNFTSYEPTPSWNILSSDVLDHGGPPGSHHQQDDVHQGMSTHYDFENEQLERHVLTQLLEDDIFNQDLAYAQSEEENSDYDNNADESVDDTPFPDEGDDEEEENVGPDLTREHAPPPVRPRVYESHMPFHSREIPTLIICQVYWMWMPSQEILTKFGL
ncbi:uncharacterized protein [Nicotiana tomentosiformis]|uniref:uncharacterized protein n=1 Tax=Nicotiana tomentosiformis TaxID=4098 RepID=UPI00388CE723